jgi:hypothetical protein
LALNVTTSKSFLILGASVSADQLGAMKFGVLVSRDAHAACAIVSAQRLLLPAVENSAMTRMKPDILLLAVIHRTDGVPRGFPREAWGNQRKLAADCVSLGDIRTFSPCRKTP